MDPARPDEQPVSAYDEKTRMILRAIQQGDRSAVELLFQRVAPALLSWAHLRMSPAFRRRIDPHEVVQEVWLRAMQRFAELDPETTTFRAWIFRVAHFVLIEMSRQQLRAQGNQHAATAFLAARPSSETGVSSRFAREDAVQEFLERVEALRRGDRELVVLRGLEGCSFGEIAGRLGGNAEAWEKRWQRLRARIVHQVAPEYLL